MAAACNAIGVPLITQELLILSPKGRLGLELQELGVPVIVGISLFIAIFSAKVNGLFAYTRLDGAD